MKKEEYRNGDWYANDVRAVDARSMPRADCWCFGFPCQDISVAGKQLGFAGKRSSLFFAVTGLIRDLKEEDRPSTLFIENVKNLLSVNGGFDFARLLVELDEIGYDAEWSVLNSKDFGVPQNRERVFIIGHLRGRGGREVFPIGEADEVYNTARPDGDYIIKPDGNEPKVAIPVLTPDRMEKRQNGRRFKGNDDEMFTLTSQDRHGVMVREATKQGYAIANEGDSINLAVPGSTTRRGRVGKGVANTLDTSCNQGIVVADGIYTGVSSDFFRGSLKDTSRCLKSEKHDAGVFDGLRIRRLTPKECFRLQGWTDEYYERAKSVNADSQLYKQAGNGVTVNVIQAIADRLDR